MKREQFYNQLKTLRVPYRFALGMNHLFLFSAWQKNPFKIARLAFQFGFLQGQRASEAEKLKKKQKELTLHAPGYGYLTAIIGKHMGDEAFIRGMLVSAHSLDKASQELREARTSAAYKEGAVGHAKKT